jgi:hypothetical protein
MTSEDYLTAVLKAPIKTSFRLMTGRLRAVKYARTE